MGIVRGFAVIPASIIGTLFFAAKKDEPLAAVVTPAVHASKEAPKNGWVRRSAWSRAWGTLPFGCWPARR